MKAEKENIYTWNNYLSVLFSLKLTQVKLQ